MRNALLLACSLSLGVGATEAEAQDVGESIDMTMSSGAPTQYFFRGLPQNDQGFIFQANANLDVALYDSPELQFIIPVGFWFSLHPGNQAPSGRGPAAWYESRMNGGFALAGPAFRADARLTVYSSPNGSFRDVYELTLSAQLRDDVLWTAGNPDAAFRGLFPSVVLAQELEGARDGRNEGTYAELRLSPRLRVASSPSLMIELALPLALGVSLNDYYELPDGASAGVESHGFGYASAAAVVDIFPLFIARRLGLYTVRPSLEVLFPAAAADLPRVDSVELVAQIESILRF